VEVIQRNAFDFRGQSRWATENLVGFLKKVFSRIFRFLLNSRKIILLIFAIVLITLLFNFLIASWVNNNTNNETNDRTISTTGSIYVRGLELYGGDIKSESGHEHIDWGELTLGTSKNASFYVRSTSNVDVKLALSVNNWMPEGIEDYIRISWDYNGTLLRSGADQVPLLVNVNLNVSSSGDFIDFIVENGVTSFGFNMTIYASGV
jgi:hypothetical protein